MTIEPEDADHPESWTEEERKAITALTLHKIQEEGGPGPDSIVTVEFELVPGPEANPDTTLKALKMFGYAAELSEGSLLITVPDVTLTLEAIWAHEARINTIGEARGYIPEGWGFWEP